LGDFKVKDWRKMRGQKKTATILFRHGRWFLRVVCLIQERQVCRPYAEVSGLPDGAVDPGVASVLTDSYGEEADTPKPLKASLEKLAYWQRKVSRQFEHRKAEGLTSQHDYSNRLRRNIRKLGQAHTDVFYQRDDAAKKNAAKLEGKYGRIAVEEHGLQFMFANRRLARSASDVAIGKQKLALQSAFGKDRYFEASNRRVEGGNSQTCLCGNKVDKKLSERWHKCDLCGLEGPRDQMSAIIVQYETFGTLPDLCETSGLGLSRLKNAVSILEQGRGGNKGASTTRSGSKSEEGKQGSGCRVSEEASNSPFEGELEIAGAERSARVGVKTAEALPSAEAQGSLIAVQTRLEGEGVFRCPDPWVGD
jgi:hypothetical protein